MKQLHAEGYWQSLLTCRLKEMSGRRRRRPARGQNAASRLGHGVERLEDRIVLHHPAGLEVASPPDGAMPSQLAAEYRPGELLVGFEGDVAEVYVQKGAEQALARAERNMHGRDLHSPRALGYLTPPAGNGRVATLWQLDAGEDVLAAAMRIAQLPGVAYAEPNYIVTTADHQGQAIPSDSRFGDLWGLHNTGTKGATADADIDAPEAWALHTGSSQTVVGVIDTGINYNHPDLSGNIWVNPLECSGGFGTCSADGIDNDGNGYIDDFYGWDFVNNDNDPMDDNKHGTHVGGTIGAEGNNANGVVGVNWDVQMMALKFLDAGGSGSTAAAIAALDYINATIDALAVQGIDLNIVATNNSWGGGAFSQALMDAIDESGRNGLLFVAAAGNNGASNASYPALYDLDNIISVAASDQNDQRASFSNYGDNVDLAAPGVGILSTVRNSYGKLDGTSMATPHVTGAAALVADLIGPTATYAQVRNYILSSVDLVPALTDLVVTDGRLNVARALEQVQFKVVGSTPAAGDVLAGGPGFTVQFSHPVTGLEPSDFRIVRPDANATELSANAVTTSNGGRTAEFTFTTSPFLAGVEGPHKMTLAYGAATTSTSLHDQNLQAWSATIYYDTSPLAVSGVETEPAQASGAISLPVESVTITFNQWVDANTIDVSDLLLSQGVVTGATAVNLDDDEATFEAATYLVDGVTDEADWIVTLPKGAVADLDGNPVAAFSDTLILDIAAAPLGSPFVQITPEGSLIYEAIRDGILAPAGDLDEFTIQVDPNQTITAVVRPDGDLQPTVSVAASGAIFSSTAVAAGSTAVVQTVPAPADGLVTISVGSDNDTTGGYRLELLLNSVAAEEGRGSLASAQPIDGSFLAIGSGSRGAARGSVQATIPSISSENETGDAFLSNQNNLDGSWEFSNDAGGGTSLWKINGGAGVTGRVGDRSGRGPLAVVDDQDTWYFTAEAGDVLTATAAGFSVDIHDLTGDQLADGQGTFTYEVQQTGEYWIHVYGSKGDYTLTLDRTTAADLAPGDEAFDFYEFTAQTGEVLHLAADTADQASVGLRLYDGSDVLVASSSPTSQLDAIIDAFTVPAGGAYKVRVSGSSPSAGSQIDYGVVVTRNLVLDTEANSSQDTAQQLAPGGVVLGHIGFGQSDVLWVGSTPQNWNDGSFFVDQITLDAFPTDLSPYQVLFVDSFGGVPAAHESAIAQFVAAGGGLVTENGGSESAADYSWVPNADDFTWTTFNQDSVHVTEIGKTHPVTAGLSDSDLSNWAIAVHNEFPTTGGMDVLTVGPDGAASLLAGTHADGRLAYLGMDASGHQTMGEAQRLIQQALRWAADQTDLDYFAIPLAVGESIDVTTQIPGGAVGEYENSLATLLEVIGPDGLPVAQAEGSLSYAAEASGTHWIEVSSINGERGDYILSVNVQGSAATSSSRSDALAGTDVDPAALSASTLESSSSSADATGLAGAGRDAVFASLRGGEQEAALRDDGHSTPSSPADLLAAVRAQARSKTSAGQFATRDDVRARRADAESTGHDEFFSNLGKPLIGAADLEI